MAIAAIGNDVVGPDKGEDKKVVGKFWSQKVWVVKRNILDMERDKAEDEVLEQSADLSGTTVDAGKSVDYNENSAKSKDNRDSMLGKTAGTPIVLDPELWVTAMATDAENSEICGLCNVTVSEEEDTMFILDPCLHKFHQSCIKCYQREIISKMAGIVGCVTCGAEILNLNQFIHDPNAQMNKVQTTLGKFFMNQRQAPPRVHL